MSVYKEVAEKYGFPRQVLAAIHSREHDSLNTNPKNGQGVYQLYSLWKQGKVWEPGKELTIEEFKEQTEVTGEILYGLSKDIKDISSDEGIKELFFKFNGSNEYYIAQAKKLGFNTSRARDGEGSPYVMNLADPERDYQKNQSWKQFRYDENGNLYPANQDHGAWLKFVALGGSQTATCNGGLNLDEANNLMAIYKKEAEDHKNDKSELIVFSSEKGGSTEEFSIDNNIDCKEGTLANCVTFVKYFLNSYTKDIKIPRYLNDGKYVVGTLLNNGFAVGTVPRPYAVFSKQGGRYGHTGVVLGVNIKDNKIIIGEANCGLGINGIRVLEESLSDYMSGYTYAYTDLYVTGL